MSFPRAPLNWVSLTALWLSMTRNESVKPKNVDGRGREFASQPKMKVRPSASCQKKHIFFSLCHKGEWDVLLSCGVAKKSEGSQGCKGRQAGMHAGMHGFTNYHLLNRELVPNEHCCNATQHLARDHKTYEYCMVRRGETCLNYTADLHFKPMGNLKATFD